MRLKVMQAELPKWHVDVFEHAVTHGMKALGKLAGIIDDADHARAHEYEAIMKGNAALPPLWNYPRAEVAKFAADLVVCALKMAQLCPGGPFDLESAVVARVRDKNPPGAFPSALGEDYRREAESPPPVPSEMYYALFEDGQVVVLPSAREAFVAGVEAERSRVK